MKGHKIIPAFVLLAAASPAWADGLSASTGAVQHLQKLNKLFPQPRGDAQGNPPVILPYQTDPDEEGMMGTYQPGGATPTKNNAFFGDLGTNGRACSTCH